MNVKNPTRFDIGALKNLVGANVFARGEKYHRDGHAQILSLEPGRVLAQVTGSEDYRTEVTLRGKQFGGECSCPAFEDWGFCKHMVAAALAANDAPTEDGGALSRIRDHLKAKSVDALVAMIVELAERDPALFRKLDTASIALRADDKTLETQLRKAIDSATRTGDFIDYREASGWASGVDAALDALAEIASARAAIALKLAVRAIERIEQATESMDDSDGHCGALLERARDIHLAAARAARPEPVQFARDLFARETEQDHDAFDGAAALYADALGETGLAEYRRLAAAAWDKLPACSGGGREDHEFNYDYHRLSGILDFFAERDGDVEARIALRAKDLSSPWSYLQLAEFCRAQGRQEEALRRAEEGLWLFEDKRPDERLVLFTAELLAEAGRGEDAEARLWRAFEKAPSRALYDQLGKFGGKIAGERAVTSLEDRLAKMTSPLRSDPADLLIEILTREKMYDAAWASARKHGASPARKNALAEASEKTHPVEALRIYAERVEQLVNGGGNPGYAQAAALIARMGKLRSAAEQMAYIAALKERFLPGAAS